jgi:hypothetical protein
MSPKEIKAGEGQKNSKGKYFSHYNMSIIVGLPP